MQATLPLAAATRSPSQNPPIAGWMPVRADATSRRWALLAVLALHALALLGLLQAGAFKRPQPVAPDVSLALIATPLPRQNPPPHPLPAPQLNVPNLALPLPEFSVAAAPREVPAAIAPPSPIPVSPPAPAARETAPTDTLPTPVATPAPKPVSAGSLRYRVEPAVEVPRLSRRAGEAGRVQLRVVFDTSGRPRQVELALSSGFARLDAQALEAMQVARIQPYLEGGQAIEVVALATLEYELD